jgi:hypothetical protein
MADLLRGADVRELIEHRTAPAVSIFLPTHRTRAEREQDPIRLRNLLDQAESRLVSDGVRPADARSLLAPGRELLDSGIFWSYLSDGLAVFLAPGWSRSFRLPLRLPELVVVGDRFHVKPLLDILTFDHRFFVLALSQKDVRLLEGSRHDVQQVDLGDVPTSLAEVLKYDDLEREQNLHVSTRGGLGARAVFHGHGAGGEVDHVLLERWVRAVDDGVQQVLAGQDAPLVLAGVGYEQAMFRAGTRYRRVLSEGIEGNPEQLSPEQLHERAWEIVEPVATEARRQAADRFREAAGRGSGAASDIEHVIAGAVMGRVETLFVPVGVQVWGTIDPQTNDVVVHRERQPGDEDLLDRAAVETMLAGGMVYTVAPEELPGPGPAAALLRY